MRSINYELLSEHIRGSMKLYIENRVKPGGFLIAVLSNDLMAATARADHINRNNLFDICSFLYNEAPSCCHGSPEKVRAWLQGEEE